jgi:glutamate carboxypeptidase
VFTLRELASMAQRIYQDIGRALDSIGMRYGTDAGYAYQAESNRPAVLETLGVVGGRLHLPDEFARINGVAPRLYLTACMILALSPSR